MNDLSNRPPNLTRRIVEDLGLGIVTGRYVATSGFPVESELCDYYGASRSVLREAVKMLTAKGLLRPRQRAGTTVEPEENWRLLDPDILRWLLARDFSSGLLTDLIDMRVAIEPRAARLAADSASGRQRAAIVAAVNAIAALDHDDAARLDAKIEFHRAVIAASNNRFMQQLAPLSETALRLARRHPDERVSRVSIPEMRRIADAIVTGDPGTAATLMEALLLHTRDALAEAEGPTARLAQKHVA